MNKIEQSVAQHYGDEELLTRILGGLQASGCDLQQLKPEDLIPVEEFHIGGREATEYVVSNMNLQPEQHVLDIGCGIGGAARYIASQKGNRVTGIDLTPEYIACAKELSKRVQLPQVDFGTASALDLPFEDGSFDAAISLHVAMNIEDREALYRETARVLKPGAVLAIFDVMRKADGELEYPVPWAKTPETSFLKTAEEMQNLLENNGFSVLKTEDRTEMALAFFRERIAGMQQAEEGQPPALGVHLVMKEQAKEKFKNTLLNIERELISPVLILAVKG